MKKILFAALLVLLLAVGGSLYYLFANLDGLVKTAIETYGSEATQTAVRVDTVKIGLKQGSGNIRGLSVANPAGFATPQAFILGEISTRIDLKSLSEEVLIIDEIIIRAPQVFFEIAANGRSNLDELKKNLGSTSKAPTESGKKPSGTEPKLIIRKVLFEGGSVQADMAALNTKTYQLKLPTIEMHDLGGKNGATPARITDQILKKLTDQALSEVQKQTVKQEVDKLKTRATDKLKGLLGR
jgi:hypothetical protein